MTTGMQSPEILLQDLNTALRELRGAARLLDDERLDAELLPAMRRLLLAEVLGDTWIMAIGGSQSAGKTTLLSTLYKLSGEDAQWLQPNEGLGERLPVLVLEDSAHQKVQGAIRQVVNENGRYKLKDKEVDAEEFRKAVSDPDPEVLLPVLKVPKRYFSRSNQAWLLLPGYEQKDRQNKTWQELMRQALVAAAGCIIVTDETRMANQQQVEIAKDMMSNELRGVQALVVISKTEAARDMPERLQELRTTAQQVFGIDASRILCTGADDPGYINEWLPELKAKIEDLSLSGGGNRKAQLARLEEVLSRDLARVLNLIRRKSMLFFQQGDGSEDGQEVLKNCLEAFDDARDALRSRYRDEVEQLLNNQIGPAWEDLQARLKEDHEGFRNAIKNTFDTVTESQQRIEADVKGAWHSAGSVLESHAAAVARLTQQALGAPEKAISLPAGTPLQRLGYVDIDRKPIEWGRPDQEDQKNLQLIFIGEKAAVDDQAVASQSTKGFKRAIALLPALSLEYARAASLMPALVGVHPDSLTEASSAERLDLVRHSIQQLGQGLDLGKTVLRSIATVLAVDVASDGDIDVIPALLGAAAASTAAEGGAATAGAATIGGVGAAVIGVVAVGYLVHSAMQEVHRDNAQGRVIAHRLLLNVKDHHKSHFTRHFDSLMDQVRVRLVQKLRERYRLDESLMEQDRLAKALADARALQRDLLDELGRSGQTVMLFNVEAAT